MSTGNISWGVKAAGSWGWQLYHLHVPTVLKPGSLNLLETSGPVQTWNGITLPVQVRIHIIKSKSQVYQQAQNQALFSLSNFAIFSCVYTTTKTSNSSTGGWAFDLHSFSLASVPQYHGLKLCVIAIAVHPTVLLGGIHFLNNLINITSKDLSACCRQRFSPFIGRNNKP